MPWNEVLPMDEKTRFLADVRSGLDSVAGLCRRHGISRKTGYKWIHRYEEQRWRSLERQVALGQPDPRRSLHRLRGGRSPSLGRLLRPCLARKVFRKNRSHH